MASQETALPEDFMPNEPDRRRSDSASRVIAAPVAKIYAAFSDAAALMQWLPPSNMSGHALEYDFRPGGHYRIELLYAEQDSGGQGKTTGRSDITNGTFLELVPDRRIRQSVVFESGDPAFSGEMTMTWLFESAPGGTTVTVTADNVPRGISPADHQAGLNSSLDNLAKFVER